MVETNKSATARTLGISRSTLYYVSKKEKADWVLKVKIEEVLREHPAYGSRRIAAALHMNRKPVKRVMRKYGIKPYRRRRKKWRKNKVKTHIYPNLLLSTFPAYPHHIWAADFTEVWWRDRWVYIATVIDLYTREIAGVAVSLRKGSQLVLQALYGALLARPRPDVFHSDNGKEYDAEVFTTTLLDLGIRISRSKPGCPWENGYQESFYGKWKLDLGDPNRFTHLGELVAEIYRTIWAYNNTRIHSALNMPPREFAKQISARTMDIKRVS